MTKNINIKKSPAKKITKMILIPLLVLLSPVILYLLYVLFNWATDPILDKIDHDKFNTLDTQMQGLYQNIETAASSDDEWSYSALCDSELSGDWPTGNYDCTTLISLQKTITSVQELNTLQAKYYPIINSNVILLQKTELNTNLPGDFGKKFTISSAEKQYTEKETGFGCNYLIDLSQNERDASLSYEANNSYGSKINNGIGNLLISLRCSAIARDYWFMLSSPSMRPSPDAPIKRP